MMIQITQSGNVSRFHVEQCEIVQRCRYVKCGAEFLTIDPDQIYCKTVHSVQAYQWRKLVRELTPVHVAINTASLFRS